MVDPERIHAVGVNDVDNNIPKEYKNKKELLNLQKQVICTPKVRQTFGVHIFMRKEGRKNKKYLPEFKLSVILELFDYYGKKEIRVWI